MPPGSLFLIVNITSNYPSPGIPSTYATAGSSIFQSELKSPLMIDYRSIIVDAIVILTCSYEMKNITFINSIPVFVVNISKLSNSCRVNFILMSRRVCENHIFHPFVIILTAYITVNPFTIIGAFCSKRNISPNLFEYYWHGQ